MITGAHTIVFADDAEAARAFFRDVLELPNVNAGDGWLIFKLPPGELACHPNQFGEGSGPVADQGFGLLAMVTVPGAGQLGIYEPRHPTAFDLPS